MGNPMVMVFGLPLRGMSTAPNHGIMVLNMVPPWMCCVTDVSIVEIMNTASVTAMVYSPGRMVHIMLDNLYTTNVMVTMSKSGCIQVSEETAALLVVGGKKKWLTQRKDKIGTLKTFWLLTQNSDTWGTATQSAIDWEIASFNEDAIAATRERREQLIHWTVEQLVDVLKKIVYVHERRC